MTPVGEEENEWLACWRWTHTHRDLPQTQIVFAGKVVMGFDPVLQSLHSPMGDPKRRFIFLTELGVVFHRRRRHVVLG